MKNSKRQADEHAEFQRWVYSLSKSQLENAMECCLDNGEINTSSTGSHEYELFLEMIRLQPPLFCPIHPRAVSYNVASSRGKTDGRNAALEVLRGRTQQPRLFQFYLASSRDNANSFLAGLGVGAYATPAPRASGGGRRRGGRGRVSPLISHHNNNPPEQRFEVFARKCITEWGDAMNVGCTHEQRTADQKLLQCTLLDPKLDSKGRTFIYFDDKTNNIDSADSLLRLLKIVSRGNFLSLHHHHDNKQQPQQSRNNNIPLFCAPWLDPTSRWFSLPMYLASRFEVALWESFINERRVCRLPRDRPWEHLQEKLNQDAIEKLFQNALLSTLVQDILQNEKEKPSSNIRDGVLFDLVEAIEFWRAKQALYFPSGESYMTNSHLLRSISASPVLEIGTTTHQIRLFMRQHLQAAISKEMERYLVESLDSAPVVAYPGISSANSHSQVEASRRAKKKRQRKKVARKRNQNSTPSNNAPNLRQGQRPDGGSSDEESDGGGGTNVPSNNVINEHENIRLTFPENGTPFVERNRNIVLCLSMLNDVINGAFRQLGLEASDDESDSSVVRGNKGRNKDTISASKAACSSNNKPAQVKVKTVGNSSNKPIQQVQHNQQKDIVQHDEERRMATPTNDGQPKSSPQGSRLENESDSPPLSPASGSGDTFPSQHCFPQGFFPQAAPFGSNPWAIYHGNDGWSGPNGFLASREPRERSILTEFFLEQERADANRLERITASSTAASLASSTDKNNEDTISISDKFFISLDNGSEAAPSDIASTVMSVSEFPSLDIYQEDKPSEFPSLEIYQKDKPSLVDPEKKKSPPGQIHGTSALERQQADFSIAEKKEDIGAVLEARSISPEAPATPSPRLSPILLSLDDLRDIREGAKSVGKNTETSEGLLPVGVALTVPSSLPSSPVEQSKRRLVSSLSREDLRIKAFRDDSGFVRKARRSKTATEATAGSPSYRNVVAGSAKMPALRSVSSDAFMKSTKKDPTRFAHAQKGQKQEYDVCARSENAVEFNDDSQNSSAAALSYRNVAAKSVKSVSGGSWNLARVIPDSKGFSPPGKNQPQGDLCARSETAVEGHEDLQNWHDSRRTLDDNNPDNITVGKDGSTTITSAMSHRESEETSHLREELQNFRDLVLTLGAEVSKLKNQLAAQRGGSIYPPFDYPQGFVQPVFGAASFDPESMTPFFQKGQAIGAMSDAGVHNRGEYESQVSEDDEAFGGKAGYGDRRLSSGATIAGSDVSIEPTSSSHALQGPVGLPAPMSKDSHAENGLQTRLTEDILKFMSATEMQHKKLNRTRDAAVERMTRLVNTLWPRAQVKLYGSHVTGLCLPSSDVDFVICLPAVHKNAPAVAPGVLEGRNAINETSQKLLARKLKGESWIDPRSMKLIERTVVPVIKVATKDTRARTVHLDISFDSPEHHGLEAVMMVKQIVDELPMIRPLVLILKQFLLDRGLLTAYTGGLSSYGLFLMVARYLQEQPSLWGDCGSLLMGFLDFYGNYFDPRSTGISVGRRQYFTRPNYVAAQQQQVASQHMWAGVSPSPGVIPSPTAAAGNPGFYRRNTMGETGPLMRPPRFQSSAGKPGPRYMRHMPQQQPTSHPPPPESHMDHSMPFTFDPLFVEDPLSYGNNVGRNSFRIFQVQRAFSDAHRALVASLEWDIQSTGELHNNNDYPLLKCLLQSEDVLYEL